MAKNLLSSASLVPTLHAGQLSFSRLFASKRKAGSLGEEEIRVYANVEECLKEGVRKASAQSSVYAIYSSFASGCAEKAYTEAAAVLALLAYECAATFKGKETLSGKDWGEGFRKGYEVAKSLYDGPLLDIDASFLKEAYARKIETLDDLIALFSLPREHIEGGEVFYDFLKAQAIGFASPKPLSPSSPFEEMSETRLEKEGYDLSFTLQFLNCKHKEYDEVDYLGTLNRYGISPFYEAKGTQVHVATKTFFPAKIIAKSQEYGEFISLRLTNAYVAGLDELPHLHKNKRPSIGDRGVLAFAPTKKAASLFLDLGAEIVLEEGKTTSIHDLLLCFSRCSSDNVILLPCDKRLYLLGKIAARMEKKKNVIVLKCFSLQQSYFALSDALFEEEGIEALIESLNLGIETLVPLNTEKGKLLETLRGYENIETCEFCFIMHGDGCEEEINEVRSTLEGINPYLELGELDIGLPGGIYLIGGGR